MEQLQEYTVRYDDSCREAVIPFQHIVLIQRYYLGIMFDTRRINPYAILLIDNLSLISVSHDYVFHSIHMFPVDTMRIYRLLLVKVSCQDNATSQTERQTYQVDDSIRFGACQETPGINQCFHIFVIF